MRLIVGLALGAVGVHANSLCLEGGFLGKLGHSVCTLTNNELTKAEKAGLDLVNSAVDTAKTDLHVVTHAVQGAAGGGTGDDAGNSTQSSDQNSAALTGDSATEVITELISFVTTVNPVSIVKNYVTTAQTSGYAAANAQLQSGAGKEVEDVVIGAVKGSVNGLVKYLPYSQWLDLAICLVSKGVAQALERLQSPKLKRDFLGRLDSAAHVAVDGLDIVTSCESKDFNSTANAAIFTLTNGDQKLGASFAKVAPLLTPWGEEATAARYGKLLFSLAFPGDTVTGRIMKLSTQAGHTLSSLVSKRQQGAAASPVGVGFTYDEAIAVKNALISQPDFIKSCIVGTDTPTVVGHSAETARRVRRGANARRQNDKPDSMPNVVLLCPPVNGAAQPPRLDIDVSPDVPSVVTDIVPATGPLRKGASDEPVTPDAAVVYNTAYADISSANLVASPPDMVLRNDSAASKADILADFAARNSSQLAWSDEMTTALAAAKLWSSLRDVFTSVSDLKNTANSKSKRGALDNFAQALGIYSSVASPTQLALTAGAKTGFMKSDSGDANVKALQKFTGAVIDHVKQVATDVAGMKPDDPALADPKVSYYYTPPSDAAKSSTSRGLHAVGSALSFIAEELPGLSVALPGDDSKVYRMGAAGAAWALLPGLAAGATAINVAAQHTTFSDEIAEKGRVSMVVHV